jgi:hypothetical protein
VTVNGRGWVFETALGSSEVITLSRGAQGISVTDQTGADRYTDLGPAPKFPQLAPGVNTVAISMVGATAASSVSGNWRSRYEGVY